MRRSGWNPTRRNRSIGTAGHGRGQNNRMWVPAPRRDNWATEYEIIPASVALSRRVGSRDLPFIVQPTLPGYAHSCTIDDIARLLTLLPSEDIEDIALFVLRQPTRKQIMLHSIWGRIQGAAEIGPHVGPTIFLEAQPISGSRRWGRSLAREGEQELERLRAAGVEFEETRRHYILRTSMATARNVQLYHTLPHEVGHHVDYRRRVDMPSRKSDDVDAFLRLSDLYNARPDREKEGFAHSYADAFRARQQAAGRLPFARIENTEQMRSDGLDPRWFGLSVD